MTAQASLSAEERRRRVREVREAVARLELVERQLEHAMAALPAMLREVQGVRGDVEKALEMPTEEEP